MTCSSPRELRADRAVVALGHGPRIEEVRRVVELQPRDLLAAIPPRSQRRLDLCRDRSGGRVVASREAPEVAHRAAPRALASGQEDRPDACDVAPLGRFVFDRQILEAPRIVLRPGTSEIDDEAVARRRRVRVGGRA